MTHLYRHFDADGRLLYVGISRCALMRLGQHSASGSEWVKLITRVEIETFATRKEAAAAEVDAIRREAPLHNLQHARKRSPRTRKNRSESGPQRLGFLNAQKVGRCWAVTGPDKSTLWFHEARTDAASRKLQDHMARRFGWPAEWRNAVVAAGGPA